MPAGVSIIQMSANEKLREAMERSLPLLPGEARMIVLSLIRPESIATIGGTLIAWAGAHAFGVGEIVDVLLLGVGFISLGLSVFEGATAFFDFVDGAISARSDDDLKKASQRFAAAVSILGIAAVQTLLMIGYSQAAAARKAPKIHPRTRVPAPTSSDKVLRLTRPDALPRGALGRTHPYGAIEVARNQTITEQRVTLMHELVHRYLSPRTGPMRKLRA